MKKTLFCTAIAVFTAIMFIGCPTEGGGGGGVSAPDAPNISEAPAAAITKIPESEEEARRLFQQGVSYLQWELESADRDAIVAAQKAQGIYFDYYTEAGQKAALAYVQTHGTETSLSAEADLNLPVARTGSGTITVTGSSSGSGTLPVTLSEYATASQTPGGYAPKVGDKSSSSSEESRTFKITGDGPAYYGYKVAGTVTVETESSSDSEVVEVISEKYGDTTYIRPKVRTGSSDYTTKYSYTLAISDGSIGARFRYSSGNSGSSEKSARTSSGSWDDSDLEVYDNAGTRIFRLQSSNTNSPNLSNILPNLFGGGGGY